MKKIFLIISVAFTLIFIGCGDGSKEEAKKLLTQILTLVGIPQDLVVTICQDKNDNGSCDSGEIQAKIAINKGDLVDNIWKKVEFNANGEYIRKNYDPTKNIIMEIEDKKNLKYDNGQLTFKYNPNTKELSVLQAIIDADFLSEKDTKALKNLSNREEVDRVLLDTLRHNQNLLKDENMSTDTALVSNLEELGKGLIELNVSKELPEQIEACENNSSCVDEIMSDTKEELELTKEEAEEIAKSKKVADGYIVKLSSPALALCSNGKKYYSSIAVGKKGQIDFAKLPMGIDCTITVHSGAVIDSNNNGKLDITDRVLEFDMVGSVDATHITPLTSLLVAKKTKGENVRKFESMIKTFDPVTAPARVLTNSGIERVKIEKLIVLMEVLKSAMREQVDIANIDLLSVISTKSGETIEDFSIDTLLQNFQMVLKRVLEIEQML